MTKIDGKAILELPMLPNDAEAATIRDYLKALLLQVWTEEEGFNGKRPFGNSGWQHEVIDALVVGKFVGGKVTRVNDEIEDIECHNENAAHAAVQAAIKALS